MEDIGGTEAPSESHEDVAAREVAEAEFERFAAAMDLEFDTKRMDADDLKSFNEQKHRILRAIMRGHLVVDGKGQFVYTPQGGSDHTPITFYEPTGASMMAMDRKKKGEDVGKMYATMADMTRTSPERFARMANRDLKICQTIAVLFLA